MTQSWFRKPRNRERLRLRYNKVPLYGNGRRYCYMLFPIAVDARY